MQYEIHNDDYRSVLPTIKPGRVAAVITDPPYDMPPMTTMLNGTEVGTAYSTGTVAVKIDIAALLAALLPLFETKQHFCGVFYCNRRQLASYLNWADEQGLQYNVGVWHKTNPPPFTKHKYLGDLEYWVYIKGNKSPILGRYDTKSLVYRSKQREDDGIGVQHPTVKPVGMLRRFVINHTLPGDTILDPFMGSGSTGMACAAEGRQFIGVELNPEYFRVATERISSAYLPN